MSGDQRLFRLLLTVAPVILPQQAAQDPRSDLVTSIVAILNGKPCPTSYHHLSATLHRLIIRTSPQFGSSGNSYGIDQTSRLGMVKELHGKIEDEMNKAITGFAREWRGVIMGRESGWLKRLVAGWKVWESRVVSIWEVDLQCAKLTEEPARSGVRLPGQALRFTDLRIIQCCGH